MRIMRTDRAFSPRSCRGYLYPCPLSVSSGGQMGLWSGRSLTLPVRRSPRRSAYTGNFAPVGRARCNVRDRDDTSPGARAPTARPRSLRGRDEDPRPLPAGAGGRGLRRPARDRRSCAASCGRTRSHLGLDGQLFVDEYNSRHFDPRDDDVFPRRRPTARERRNRKRESHIILIAIVAIVALAVLVIAAASYPGSDGRETPLPAATSAPAADRRRQLGAHRDDHRSRHDTHPGGAAGQVTVVAERACYVTVYEGEGTKGRVLFSDTLDPDTKLSEVKLPRVEGGYTFELGNAGGVSFVVGDDRHLFSPDNMNVFWLDPDTETIKADRVTPGARGRPRDGVGDPDRPDGRHQLLVPRPRARRRTACGWSGSSRSTTARTEIVAALSALLASGVDLVLTSGGLGPTHDDRTVACVAQVAGVELVLDEPTLAQIDAIVAEFARARGVDPAGFERGNRKQATVPAGAEVLRARRHRAGRDRAGRRPAHRRAARAAGRAVADVARRRREPAGGAAAGRRAAAQGAAHVRRAPSRRSPTRSRTSAATPAAPRRPSAPRGRRSRS